MSKMPQEANIDTYKPNGTQPNQNFEIFFTKSRTPTLFRNFPNFKKPMLISAKSKT